jgi:signal transduction histidine kinase
MTGLLLGIWVSRPLARRLQSMLEFCYAWLRGNLALRIADPTADDLGLLAGQLDLLAEHLEQDEQDLAELREHNTRLTDQVRALAVDEERERLARELHDGVKQHLFSLSMTASALQTRLEGRQSTPPDLKEMIQEIETTSKTVQRELTRLIENLQPGSLEEKGLAAALNDYTLLFGAREHILIYLVVQGNDALLAPSVAESLYRVAQEALHNVARHARASRVDVQLRCLSEQAILTIRDNGIGFDTSQTHRGLGLGNMQDRLMSIGGRLTIDSGTGSGTTVRAEVGLTRQVVQDEIAKPAQDRPNPESKNWAWLGQRLMIPVGQTWPWLPADQAHLRQPLVEPSQELLTIRREACFGGLGQCYILGSETGGPLVRLHHRRTGLKWRVRRASWALRRVQSPRGVLRMALMRNGQPLAALQSQGRLLNTWTEIIYDDRGYRLARDKDHPDGYVLTDQENETLLTIERGVVSQIQLCRALPLPLLAVVAAQTIAEESSDII